ncbi:hypothetical protein CPB83DRAFT_908003 [Crepidotus variabilis]|uniref:J domain-containing protein n=1 Tax=Crepidotus variabilis TaxID=179855 RepID=A0A9P6EDK4_9AGAR|nr:hypothetical protein CPB83DRAFT_908003 [Crepidotus variabilis]
MKLSEAYEVLGIEEGSSMDDAKVAYKQIALRTHPDKNPNNPDATAEFQRVGEAYNLIVKCLDPSSKPSFGCGRPGCPCQDDGSYEEEDYNDFNDLFFRDLFEHFMRSNAGYFSRRSGPRPFRPKPETQEEYQERSRRLRKEQLEAAERRKREAIARKERQANEREQVTDSSETKRLDAEKRQKAKVQEKKAKLDKERRLSEERARALKKKAQENRSAVFVAARQGDSVAVKKGIWENAVDAAGGGGEITLDGASFVMNKHEDAKETLLHIAASKGDLDLIEWLDSHSVDPEERNGHDLTAAQIAVKHGHVAVECPNLLKLAVQSCQPEIVDLILYKEIVSEDEITEAIVWASSASGTTVLQGKAFQTQASKTADIMKLLYRFGDIPDDVRISRDNETAARSKTHRTPKASPEEVPKPKISLSSKPSHSKKHLSRNSRRGHHGRGGGQSAHSGHPNH